MNYISLSHTTHVTIGPSSFLELPDGSTTTKLCLVQPFSKIGPGLDTSHTTAHKLAWMIPHLEIGVNGKTGGTPGEVQIQ